MSTMIAYIFRAFVYIPTIQHEIWSVTRMNTLKLPKTASGENNKVKFN